MSGTVTSAIGTDGIQYTLLRFNGVKLHPSFDLKLLGIQMNIENDVIDNLAELERFLLSVEKGGLGLEGVAGVGMATSHADGRHFVAVFGDNHKLLLGRWVTPEIFESGQDMVKNGLKSKH